MTGPVRTLLSFAALACLLWACQDADEQTTDTETSSATDEEVAADDVASTATTTGGDDVTSEAEVRIREIISDYDGRRTDEGTLMTVPAEVLFDFDEATLRRDAHAALDEILEVLEHYDTAPVEIVGHTDAQGAADYNLGLSERRAEAVADHLVTAGVERARLHVEGRGEVEPVADNDSSEGRQQNRRVEILLRDVDPEAER